MGVHQAKCRNFTTESVQLPTLSGRFSGRYKFSHDSALIPLTTRIVCSRVPLNVGFPEAPSDGRADHGQRARIGVCGEYPMTINQRGRRGAGSNRFSIVLALLAFSVFINYIDRSNLSIAAPMLKDELGMSASQLGLLLSSFFWTYSLFLILSGWLVDRVSVSWVMAIGFFLWSAATSATGFLHGFTALLVVRLVLGIGESVAYPSYSKILAKYFPASQRASANSIIASGLACGPAFGMLLGGMLMSRFGWRSFFVALGSVSLVWLLPWFRWMPRGPGITVEKQLGAEPTTLEILKQRSAWGTFLGLFSIAYSLYFLIAWLPFYLVRERYFSMDTMAKVGAAVFLTQAVCSIGCGRIAGVYCGPGRQIPKSSFLCSLNRPVGITHGG
jgi:MFS family permease